MRLTGALAIFFILLFLAPRWGLAEDSCPGYYASLDPKKLEELVLSDEDRNLFWQQQETTTPAEAQVWNKALIQAMTALPEEKRNPKRLYGLDEGQRKQLYNRIYAHPTARSMLVSHYSKGKNIGFCFGRAIAAHIEALRMGVAKENIRKIWIVGNMRSSTVDWGHHVATMIRGDDRKWYVMDPNFHMPLELSEWEARMQRGYLTDGRLQLFVTKPRRFGPHGEVDALPIRPTTVNDPFYNQYFEDMMAYSRKEAHQLVEERRAAREACARDAEYKACLESKFKDDYGI